MSQPILYSFRRCPYAMRVRLALLVCGIKVELREVLLRDKPPEFLAISPDGTVPLLVLPDGEVIPESLDIMLWAMGQNDPENWAEHRDASLALIAENDGPFKTALDRYKYHSSYDADPEEERENARGFLRKLDELLARHLYLCGPHPSLADFAIVPFVRQFCNTDSDWFVRQEWQQVVQWLDWFLDSERFAAIMGKYKQWRAGDAPIIFPEGHDRQNDRG